MRALLARQIDAKARPRPSSAENRPAIDPSEPILAVSPNFDRATDRRQPNHSTPNSDPQVRHTASPTARAFFATSFSEYCPEAYHSNSFDTIGATSGSAAITLRPSGAVTFK